MSTNHTLFKLNCDYHPRILYQEKVNSRFKSKSEEKLLTKLKELIIVCQENLYHTQELQKRAYNKGVKLRSYASNEEV